MLSYSAHTHYFSHNDRLTNSRPLSISTNIPSSPTTSSPSTAASAKFLRTPYISSRQPSVSISSRPWSAVAPSPAPSRSSSLASSAVEDVFSPGDLVGEGALLQGQPLRLVSIGPPPSRSDTPDYEEPAKEFQVRKRLGAGSYAVVYLVSEILYRPPEDDSLGMDLDSEDKPSVVYGREYAIKCLSKANLDEEALAAQMTEVTIHQSLRSHPNIVTLHRTLETSSFLLLLLEYVPGEDLFYFLEQARDHYESDSPNSSDSTSSHTPPTPSLLSNVNPSQQLSRTRLRLISSMFSQMCDAVAACHDQGVFHRDIKPENFIVTDGWITAPDGRQERKVIVKLTDFGLSTTDVQSSDMDCGSAPYMSYECRNNMAPTYRPRAADVWSLGIVLINMLYHCNPWTDTAHGACSSFSLYLRDPVNFFMNRFAGMTKPVADVLANRVFNVLDDPEDDSKRISAAGFGAWIRDLTELLSDQPPPATVTKTHHQRAISISSSTQGFPISTSTPMSHRPSSRHASNSTTVRTPALPSRSLSRAPSLEPAYERPEKSELSTVIDHEIEIEEEEEGPSQPQSRSSTNNKRRKRGARKGKGSTVASTSPTTPEDETLATLAVASQSLAREISRASKASSGKSNTRSRPYEPISMYPVPTSLLTASSRSSPVPPLPSTTTTTTNNNNKDKKPSKWKLSFGKAHGTPDDVSSDAHRSTTASNVTNLLMGLNAAPASASSPSSDDTSSTWSRGHRGGNRSPLPDRERWDRRPGSDRAISPNSLRSTTTTSTRHGQGHGLASSSSSVASSNWRSSISTTSTSTTSTSASAFSRYSNHSTSSAATSVSASSWRTGNGRVQQNQPTNVKIMDGVPWELFEVHRGQRPEPIAEVFNPPAARKQRTRKPPKDLAVGLDTINEINNRPVVHQRSSPDFARRDRDVVGLAGARASTLDLGAADDGDGPKKVQKGQIHALAKMLSALRR